MRGRVRRFRSELAPGSRTTSPGADLNGTETSLRDRRPSGPRAFVQFHSLAAIVRLAEALPRRGTGSSSSSSTWSRSRRRRRSRVPVSSRRAPVGAGHATRWWRRIAVYRSRECDSYAMWERRVWLHGAGLWVAMPEPRLPRSEVERMGRDIAAWVWDLPPLDRRWVAQFFRGIKREYGRVSREHVDAVWERNRYIVEAVDGGRSRRSVAREVQDIRAGRPARSGGL